MKRITRREIALRAVGSAIALATSASLLATAARADDDVVRMKLANGAEIELVKRGNAWYGRNLRRAGRIISTRPTGAFELASGRRLELDSSGLLKDGGVSRRGFLECVKPDCT